MYQIKQKPEDFMVEEIPKNMALGSGEYTYFLLEKKNWNTREAIKAIASRLNSREKYFNIAGVKDKKAIAKQYVSAFKISPERLENLKIKDIKIIVLGKGKERLKLGQLKGNKFALYDDKLCVDLYPSVSSAKFAAEAINSGNEPW